MGVMGLLEMDINELLVFLSNKGYTYADFGEAMLQFFPNDKLVEFLVDFAIDEDIV